MSLPRSGRCWTGKIAEGDFPRQRVADPNNATTRLPLLRCDPKLFQDSEAKLQFPVKCCLRNKAAKEQRRLLGDQVSLEEATKACAHWKSSQKENCISDVMATNDLKLAEYNGY